VRVVIAEDSVLFREGVAKLLEDAGHEVVGRAGTADELMLKVRSYKPDVAIVDVRMPPTQTNEGSVAAATIRSEHPEVGVLLLSQVVDATVALRLFTETPEGFGYLLKERVLDVDDFLEAVGRVARGGTAVDPQVVSQLLGRSRSDNRVQELSEREREVLALMAEGLSNRAIGARLFLSPKTIEAHVHAIFSKLDLEQAPDTHRRVLAVLAYLGRAGARPTGKTP
jgi:DNA-binding NarL/FixJ family response regulator